MARQKSEFVSALGTAFEMIKLIAEEVYFLGGNDNNMRTILKDRKLRQQIAKLLVANTGDVCALDIFGKSIDELVRQGNYDWANNSINDHNFKADEMHQTEVFLKHFGQNMSMEAVLNALDADGLRPATMSELLGFGIRYPELQRQFPIVALGSVLQFTGGGRRAGCLYGSADERRLGLNWVDGDLSGAYRVAAVRK
ncbi:MAG: hypothetical protein WCV69_03010 [Patescibacteria group bacterium]|jgi:hypothetical protein